MRKLIVIDSIKVLNVINKNKDNIKINKYYSWIVGSNLFDDKTIKEIKGYIAN